MNCDKVNDSIQITSFNTRTNEQVQNKDEQNILLRNRMGSEYAAKRMSDLAEKEMPYFTKLFGFKAFQIQG